jgi:hypothetical protein
MGLSGISNIWRAKLDCSTQHLPITRKLGTGEKASIM